MGEHPFVALGRWAIALARAPKTLGKWSAVARMCGVTGLSRGSWWSPSLEGRFEGISVTLQAGTQGGMAATVGGVIDVDVVRTPRRVEVHAVTTERPLVPTGDVEFDRVFQLHGDAVSIQAVFDAETRRALRVLDAGDAGLPPFAQTGYDTAVTLAGGELRVDVPGDDFDWLREVLAQTLALARRLGRPAEMVAALARNAAQDPAPGVRLQNVLRLIEEYPRHAATRPILLAACTAEDENLRLEAARALGDEGRPVLERLAAGARDQACAAAAVRSLGDEMEPAALVALLDAALTADRVRVAEACIEGLHGRGGAAVQPLLEKALRNETGPLAVAAAHALGQAAAPGVEDVLLRLGITHSSPFVAVASAEALGRIGTAAVVMPLRDAAGHRGGAFEKAALAAVAEIHGRLKDAVPGQLSIASETSGAVSIAPETGQVSFPPRDGA